MKSLLHCLWTGPAFPYALRVFIKNWVRHLRQSKSDFQLVVWMTDDSYDAASNYLSKGIGNVIDQKGWSRCMPGVRVLFNKATINFSSFYIAMCEPELAHYPSTLQAMVKMFQAGKRFTTIGNIGRLMALNACGGIYTDIDYLNPRPETKFPKNIDTIINVFNGCSKIEFYLATIYLKHGVLIENQAIILHPYYIGALTPLLRLMAKELAGNFEDIYIETQNNYDFIENPKSKNLNKSMFTKGSHKKLIKAYKDRSFNDFNQANLEIFKGVTAKYIINSEGVLEEHNPALGSLGHMHHGYKKTGLHTYKIVAKFFVRNLQNTMVKDYSIHRWSKFTQYFSEKDIESQVQFLNNEGHNELMYSWANPGFSRLNKLESVANSIQAHYISSRNLLSRQNFLHLLKEAKTIKFGRLEKRQSVENRILSLRSLTDMVQQMTHNYLKPKEATLLLKQFLNIALIRTGKGRTTNMGNFSVEILNHQQYAGFRKLIDPEKKVLTYNDLEAFIRI